VSTLARGSVGLLCLAILVIGGVGLLHNGMYGLTIFMLLPVLLGGLAAWVFRPATWERAMALGAIVVMVAVSSLLVLRLEGLVCIVMALPLAAPLGALGSWLVYRGQPSRLASGAGAAMLLLLPPASLTWDSQARPPVFVGCDYSSYPSARTESHPDISGSRWESVSAW
jgi:hypothetical protein